MLGSRSCRRNALQKLADQKQEHDRAASSPAPMITAPTAAMVISVSMVKGMPLMAAMNARRPAIGTRPTSMATTNAHCAGVRHELAEAPGHGKADAGGDRQLALRRLSTTALGRAMVMAGRPSAAALASPFDLALSDTRRHGCGRARRLVVTEGHRGHLECRACGHDRISVVVGPASRHHPLAHDRSASPCSRGWPPSCPPSR